MNDFTFEALNAKGDRITGRHQAVCEDAVREYLQMEGLLPLSIQQDQTGGREASPSTSGSRKKTLPLSMLKDVVKSLGFLLSAGVELDVSLKLMRESRIHPRIARMFDACLDEVRKGASLSQALQRSGEILPGYCLNMIRAGELAGDLPRAMSLLAQYLEKVHRNREKLQSALTYPAILCLLALATLVFFCVFVIPGFRPFLESSGNDLPFVTRSSLAFGDFVSAYGLYGALLMLVGMLVVIRISRTPYGRQVLGRIILKVPLLGNLIEQTELARFCHSTGVLLKGGLPLLEALSNGCEVIENSSLKMRVSSIRDEIRRGSGFSRALAGLDRMPPMVVELSRVGEATGKLGDMLQDVAELMAEDTQRKTERITALLGPAITVFIGLGIGAFVVSVMLAIYSANDAIFL